MRVFVKEEGKNLIYVLLGLIFSTLAYKLFLIPSGIAAGGFTGVAQIINRLLGLPIGAVALALNVPLFLLSMRILGRYFIVRSLIAATLFSIALDNLSLSSSIQDMWLASLYGGLFLGLGLGFILRGGATTGGSDMLASFIHRLLPSFRISAGIFLIDGLVILTSAFVFDAPRAMYALISTLITNLVIDFVLEGPNAAHSFFIISNHSAEIARRIMAELDRGVTALDGIGMFSGEKKRVLLCAVNRIETVPLRRIIFAVDPSAFIISTKAHDTYGEGFKALRK